MARTKKTYGYERSSLVPELAGTGPKVCIKCDRWFAARPRQRVCDNCSPAWVCAKRSQTLSGPYSGVSGGVADHTRTVSSVGKRPGQRHRKTRLPDGPEIRSDGGALCRELARELAAELDYPDGKPVLTRAVRRRITERNVADGLQDPRDLL